MNTIVAVALILFVAELVRSSIGFGNALLAMPLLTLVLDVRTATPLFAMVSVVAGFIILGGAVRDVRLADAWRLNLGAAAGIPFGIWALHHVQHEIAVSILAVLIIVFAVYGIATPRPPHLRSLRPAFVVGAVAGMIGAAFNTSGPPVVMYGTLQRWTPQQFRATLQSFFVPSGILIVLGHGFSGLWSTDVLRLAAIGLPGMLIASRIGRRINHRLPQQRFQRVVHVFLIVIGVLMLFGR